MKRTVLSYVHDNPHWFLYPQSMDISEENIEGEGAVAVVSAPEEQPMSRVQEQQEEVLSLESTTIVESEVAVIPQVEELTEAEREQRAMDAIRSMKEIAARLLRSLDSLEERIGSIEKKRAAEQFGNTKRRKK